MFKFEANEAVIVEQQQALEAALTSNAKTQQVLRKLIRKYILEARADMVKDVRFKHGDPRHAAESIRTTVYKKVFGGNINIFNSRKAHGQTNYEPPRKLQPGQRGGNRMKRSAKTQRMMSYGPLDRGMILRWINSGVSDNRASRYGNRKGIEARHFFRRLGDREMGQLRDTLSKVIETELADILNKSKI